MPKKKHAKITIEVKFEFNYNNSLGNMRFRWSAMTETEFAGRVKLERKKKRGEPNQLRNWNSMAIFAAGGLGLNAEDESACGRPEASPSHSIAAREEKPLVARVDDCGLSSRSCRFCRVILPMKNARFLKSASFARSPDYLCSISEWSLKSAYLMSMLAQTGQFSDIKQRYTFKQISKINFQLNAFLRVYVILAGYYKFLRPQ